LAHDLIEPDIFASLSLFLALLELTNSKLTASVIWALVKTGVESILYLVLFPEKILINLEKKMLEFM